MQRIHARGEYPSHKQVTIELGWKAATGLSVAHNAVRLDEMKNLGIEVVKSGPRY